MIEISLWKYVADRKILLWYHPSIQGKQERLERKNGRILRVKACKEHTILGWRNQMLGLKKIRIAENCKSQEENFLRIMWVSRVPANTRRARRQTIEEKDEEIIFGNFWVTYLSEIPENIQPERTFNRMEGPTFLLKLKMWLESKVC